MSARLARLVVAATVVASVGLAPATGAAASRTLGTGEFSFHQISDPTPTPPVATPPNEEAFAVATCQWPPGKTSIAASAVAKIWCAPGGTRFSVPKGRSWFLLDSPIDGRRYPVQNGDLSDDVRFVHASTTPGVVSVSPVLLEFGDYSGGARPSIVVSGGSLWIYDYRTAHGSQVLRISTTTGAVLQRTSMPAISRPTCMADQYGFWMGKAGDSFYAISATLGLWHAPIGASHGVLVHESTDFLVSMTTVGDAVQVVATSGFAYPDEHEYLWRLTPQQ